MLSFYVFFGILYALLLRSLGRLWVTESTVSSRQKSHFDVSIVVAYRNEEGNLRTLLDSILKQSYRPLEVIMIDDHSEDKGSEILEEYSTRFAENEIRFRGKENKGTGKKAAIETGADSASGEIIATTDADCQQASDWVARITSGFEDKEVQLVAGPVVNTTNGGFFGHFQQIEWASILLVTQTGFSLRRPLMCSAANMAFRKSAFIQVNGFSGNDHIPTGDDEFLLKKILRQFGANSAKYMTEENVLVRTKPHLTWAGLFSQRIRWASKWRMHHSLSHTMAAMVPAFVQLAWVLSFLLVFHGWLGILVLLLIWTLKVYYERRSLGKVLTSFGVTNPAMSFGLTSIIHPWYVLCTALGTLFLNYSWKGRIYGRKP